MKRGRGKESYGSLVLNYNCPHDSAATTAYLGENYEVQKPVGCFMVVEPKNIYACVMPTRAMDRYGDVSVL